MDQQTNKRSTARPHGKHGSSTARFLVLLAIFAFIAPLFPQSLFAKSVEEINAGVDGTLKRFDEEVTGGSVFLKKAKGVLVFPSVIKAGLGFGGEYGEGAMRINGKTVEYYNIASASFGLQFGAQSKSVVMVFLNDDALKKFRESKGWKAGADGSVALLEWGAGKDINTINIKDPIVGFAFGNKGLMYNLTIEGSKFSKINPKSVADEDESDEKDESDKKAEADEKPDEKSDEKSDE